MGFKMPAIPVVVALVCAAVGLLFQIVGVATTGWISADRLDYGLWKICNPQCADISTAAEGWQKACQAFGILGILVLAACVAVGVFMCFKYNDMFPLIAAILGFVAGLCILVEFAVFAGKAKSTKYGYSFALTVVAFLLAVASGITHLLAKLKL